MTLPNYDDQQARNAAFSAVITPNGTGATATGRAYIYAPGADGRMTGFPDRRLGPDRRQPAGRRMEDRERVRTQQSDRVTEARENTRRAWTCLVVGYALGMGSTLLLLAVTS